MVQNRTGNSSVTGDPPYYMIAFKPSGIPTTSLVGSDPTNLSWTVNQPSGKPCVGTTVYSSNLCISIIGSSLLLSIVDSHGISGGQPSNLYTVTGEDLYSLYIKALCWRFLDGDSGCLPPSPSVNVTLGVNVTGSVSTCEAIGFRVYGGKEPYNITLAAPNSPVLTNVSLPLTDDILTYIDRADPNSHLMGKHCIFSTYFETPY